MIPRVPSLSARCERHRRERIAAGFARLYRCLPSYDPEAPLPSKQALLLQAAEQLAALRGSVDREQDTRPPAGSEAARRLADLERQVAALKVRNSELSYHVLKARGGGAGGRSRSSRRRLPTPGPGTSGAPAAVAARDAVSDTAASDGSGYPLPPASELRQARKDRSPTKAALEARKLDDILLSSSFFDCPNTLFPAATYTPPVDDSNFLGAIFSRAEPPPPPPPSSAMAARDGRHRGDERSAPAEPETPRGQCELWMPANVSTLTSFNLSNLLPEIGNKVSSPAYPAGLSSSVAGPPGPRPPTLMGSDTRNLTTPEMPGVNHHLQLPPAPSAQVSLGAPLPPFSSAASLGSVATLSMTSHQ
ncbi:hypothetical protein FJT64_020386 [Amphibalanus amphitrite]|uniref:BHLH domain-containing protein n=1 Tax=Amphibalanus amphitrite TaxID=1232801 RepID=A0A6A4X1Z5_AMPAM|nr:hypothetical protein FJT64_020386 [Amphibalanus amphitrite]